jgi:hypothetical protein
MKTNIIGHNPTQFQPNHSVNKKPTIKNFVQDVDTFIRQTQGIADPDKIRQLTQELDHQTMAIRKLIVNSLGNSQVGQGFWHNRSVNLNLTETERAEALNLISEEGYFGVTQTAERIMSFARALVGDNANEADIEKMRAAVQKGFDQVAKMFGGFNKLPQISRDTHNAVMSAFDEWSTK